MRKAEKLKVDDDTVRVIGGCNGYSQDEVGGDSGFVMGKNSFDLRAIARSRSDVEMFATVILDKEQQNRIKDKVTSILESYDAFVLVEATAEQIEALSKNGFKVVARDKPKAIKLSDTVIDTNQPRFSRKGIVLPHSSYAELQDPGPDRHHYIVQFIGPIKDEWKNEIRVLGAVSCTGRRLILQKTLPISLVS